MTETFRAFCDAAEPELVGIATAGAARLLARVRDTQPSWHPNGFVVYDLGQHALGRLRLHIWPVDIRQLRGTAAHVHTHVWDMCSRVLSGVYTEQIFDQADHGTGVEYGSAAVDYARDPNTLRELGRAFLRPSHLAIVSPGDVHTLPAGVAHETLVSEDSYAATLLLTSEPRFEQALVFSREPLPSQTHTRPLVDDSLRRLLLADLEARVGRPR